MLLLEISFYQMYAMHILKVKQATEKDFIKYGNGGNKSLMFVFTNLKNIVHKNWTKRG